MCVLRIYIFYIEGGVELNAFFFFSPFVSVKEDAIEDMLGSLSGVIDELCKRYAISVYLLNEMNTFKRHG